MSDVTICRACGLPRFHGPAGYAGVQCLCQWRGATLPQMYDELIAKNAALEVQKLMEESRKLADERDALLATIELMQAKQHLVGYTMRSSLKPLMDDTMPDGKHIRIGVDHRVCWEDDTPYDNLIPLYVIGDV